jgi:hypothetical protein
LGVVTRSRKAKALSEQESNSPLERAAKRQRTESSNKPASTVDLAHDGSRPENDGGKEQGLSSEDNASSEQPKAQSEHGSGSHDPGVHQGDAVPQLDPNMTKTISDIIDHSERFEQYMELLESNDPVFAKTGWRMKVESLPILDNLVSSSIPASIPT